MCCECREEVGGVLLLGAAVVADPRSSAPSLQLTLQLSVNRAARRARAPAASLRVVQKRTRCSLLVLLMEFEAPVPMVAPLPGYVSKWSTSPSHCGAVRLYHAVWWRARVGYLQLLPPCLIWQDPIAPAPSFPPQSATCGMLLLYPITRPRQVRKNGRGHWIQCMPWCAPCGSLICVF